MKLISMTDYVLENITEVSDITNFSYSLLKLKKVKNYANFLRQPLTLGMFVPCDDAENVLEEPFWQVEFEKGKVASINLIEKSKQYQQAKSKVLFEFDGGINLIRNKENFFIIEDKNGVYLRTLKNNTSNTVESLLKFSVEITLSQPAIDLLK